MASPLSELEVSTIYDRGHLAFPLTAKARKDLLRPTDLGALCESPDAEELIQALTPLAAFRALVTADDEVLMDALPMLSTEQVTGIMDFGSWRDDRLVAKDAFSWLMKFGAVGTEELYNRFKWLDEEYQLALLGPYIKIYDKEEYDRMPDAMQDRLASLPSTEFYYEICTADPEVYHAVDSIIESAMAHDMAYAISLLSHACYVPPTEQEAQAAQFRKARIEEEGFVTFAESQKAFQPFDCDQKIRQWQSTLASGAFGIAAPDQTEGGPFLSRVLSYGSRGKWEKTDFARISGGFVLVANHLCAASRVEADDEEGLATILLHVRALCGMGLEVLSGGNIELAATILAIEHPLVLFRSALHLVTNLRIFTLKSLEKAGLLGTKSVEAYLSQGKFGAAIDFIDSNWSDTFDLVEIELLKGLFNRFPVKPSVGVVNGKGYDEVIFAPIDSLTAFRDLLDIIDATLGILGFTDGATLPLAKRRHLDTAVNTGLVNALLSKSFSFAPVSAASLKAFSAMTRDSLEQTLGLFLNDFASQLGLSNQWSSYSALEKYIGAPVHGSIKTVISGLQEVGQRLLACHGDLTDLEGGQLRLILDVAKA
jgi:hypothetical protein